MKKFIILGVGIFLSIFYLVNFLKGYFFEEAYNADQMIREAKEAYPSVPEAVAIKKLSVEMSENILNSQTSKIGKQKKAADVFLGFYLSARYKDEYCRDLGVDISSFSSLFNKLHAKEYAKAIDVQEYSTSEIDDLYRKIKPQMNKVIILSMQHDAAEAGLSIAQVCQVMDAYSAIIVPEDHFSNVSPVVYESLMYNIEDDFDILRGDDVSQFLKNLETGTR
ncbi:hypothetical protein [Marinomonas sp. THO17]|uniref:hypothetical protein n=1 Tax=Marinomonas sp. THO17 TaxID=3149048 RepID=UPI00336BDF2D